MSPLFRRGAVAAALSVSLLLFASTSGALAAKGGGGAGGKGGPKAGTSSIALVLLNSTDGVAHYGQSVTFNISTTATSEPWVHLRCYQGGTQVVSGWRGYFDGSMSGRDFTLAGGTWNGGDADCFADLTNPQWTVLATTSFHVYA